MGELSPPAAFSWQLDSTDDNVAVSQATLACAFSECMDKGTNPSVYTVTKDRQTLVILSHKSGERLPVSEGTGRTVRLFVTFAP
jgi:hypothetical protein